MLWWQYIMKALTKDAKKKKEQWSFANIKETVKFREAYLQIYFKILSDVKLTGILFDFSFPLIKN
jgi:hypothetical protein